MTLTKDKLAGHCVDRVGEGVSRLADVSYSCPK